MWAAARYARRDVRVRLPPTRRAPTTSLNITDNPALTDACANSLASAFAAGATPNLQTIVEGNTGITQEGWSSIWNSAFASGNATGASGASARRRLGEEPAEAGTLKRTPKIVDGKKVLGQIKEVIKMQYMDQGNFLKVLPQNALSIYFCTIVRGDLLLGKKVSQSEGQLS